MTLAATQREELLGLARASIESAMHTGELASCPSGPFHSDLMRRGSSFVTLRVVGDLRGCCGTLDAERPLVQDLWRNAWASAFSDPRFPRLSSDEWRRLDIHISLLSTPEPLAVASEAELVASLRPFIDGLILQCGAARATFLPAVWDQMPEPTQFVRQLKMKAGWLRDFWSPDMRVFRYTTESFGAGED
jgi:AmmeMemoRadiSam system protein A